MTKSKTTQTITILGKIWLPCLALICVDVISIVLPSLLLPPQTGAITTTTAQPETQNRPHSQNRCEISLKFNNYFLLIKLEDVSWVEFISPVFIAWQVELL